MKRISIAVALSLAFLCKVWGFDLSFINKELLPQDDLFTASLSELASLSGYAENFSFTWDHPVPKEEVIDHLARIEKEVRDRITADPRNAELRLLRILMARYLYNLDSAEAASDLDDFVAKAREAFPEDIRFPWFHGVFLSQANRSVEAVNSFRSVSGVVDFSAVGLPPAFWESYALACSFALMPKNALAAFSKAEAEDWLGEDGRLVSTQLRSMFKKPDVDGSYAEDEA